MKYTGSDAFVTCSGTRPSALYDPPSCNTKLLSCWVFDVFIALRSYYIKDYLLFENKRHSAAVVDRIIRYKTWFIGRKSENGPEIRPKHQRQTDQNPNSNN